MPPLSAQAIILGASSLITALLLVRIVRDPKRRWLTPLIATSHDPYALVVLLTSILVRQATEQIRKWHALHPGFGVKVNVSPVQLRDEGFLAFLRRRVEDLETPSMLDLELTERVLIHDLEGREAKLHAISEMGVRLTLDDLGTGYSSLAYLHRLPFDSVKIDRSFVSGLPECDRSTRICRAIIDMAHGLGLSVIGEGVESDVQHASLRQMNCDALQGFLIARPMEAARLDALLSADEHQLWAPEND